MTTKVLLAECPFCGFPPAAVVAHIDYEDGRMSQWWMWQCWLDHQWHCGTAPDGLHSPPPLDWQLVLPEGFTPPEEPTDEEMAAHRAKIDRLIEEGWEGEPNWQKRERLEGRNRERKVRNRRNRRKALPAPASTELEVRR